MRGPAYSKDEAAAAVAASLSFTETLRKLGVRAAGGNYVTLRRYVERWGISTEHFDQHAALRSRSRQRARPLEEILVSGSTYSRGHLKERLYAAGLKEPVCELCGQDAHWRGKTMALVLDHINGVPDDHRLENLRIVCPNCAATLDTHCGRNVPRRDRSCLRCGESFRPRSLRQRYCSQDCGRRSAPRGPRVGTRKVVRPPRDRLIAEIEQLGFLGTGRRYGVSDNAIRKWLRQYERDGRSS